MPKLSTQMKDLNGFACKMLSIVFNHWLLRVTLGLRKQVPLHDTFLVYVGLKTIKLVIRYSFFVEEISGVFFFLLWCIDRFSENCAGKRVLPSMNISCLRFAFFTLLDF